MKESMTIFLVQVLITNNYDLFSMFDFFVFFDAILKILLSKHSENLILLTN